MSERELSREPFLSLVSNDAAAGADVPSAEVIVAARLRSQLRGYLARGKEVAAANGLTIERYDLLLCLLAAPDGTRTLSVSEIGRALHLQQTAVTELVNRAEAAGLVRRTRSKADGRVTLVVLEPDAAQQAFRVFESLRSERTSFLDVARDLERANPPKQ